MSIPQTELAWFPSQIAWSIFFLAVHFVLSKFLIIPYLRSRRKSRDSYLSNLSDKINMINSTVSKLNQDEKELINYISSERDLVATEILEEATQHWRNLYKAALQETESYQMKQKKLLSTYSEKITQFADEYNELILTNLQDKLRQK